MLRSVTGQSVRYRTLPPPTLSGWPRFLGGLTDQRPQHPVEPSDADAGRGEDSGKGIELPSHFQGSPDWRVNGKRRLGSGAISALAATSARTGTRAGFMQLSLHGLGSRSARSACSAYEPGRGSEAGATAERDCSTSTSRPSKSVRREDAPFHWYRRSAK